MFPDLLDGAKVLFYSPKGDYGIISDTEGNMVSYIKYLAICKYSNSVYYLFRCNEKYEVETDSLWSSVEKCMNVASSLCDKKISWIEKK